MPCGRIEGVTSDFIQSIYKSAQKGISAGLSHYLRLNSVKPHLASICQFILTCQYEPHFLSVIMLIISSEGTGKTYVRLCEFLIVNYHDLSQLKASGIIVEVRGLTDRSIIKKALDGGITLSIETVIDVLRQCEYADTPDNKDWFVYLLKKAVESQFDISNILEYIKGIDPLFLEFIFNLGDSFISPQEKANLANYILNQRLLSPYKNRSPQHPSSCLIIRMAIDLLARGAKVSKKYRDSPFARHVQYAFVKQTIWQIWPQEDSYLTWPPEEVIKDIVKLLKCCYH